MVCCAITADKHRCGVAAKKKWLRGSWPRAMFSGSWMTGKVYRYAPLETAWTPVLGDNYLYIALPGGWPGLLREKEPRRHCLGYCIEDTAKSAWEIRCVRAERQKKKNAIAE